MAKRLGQFLIVLSLTIAGLWLVGIKKSSFDISSALLTSQEKAGVSSTSFLQAASHQATTGEEITINIQLKDTSGNPLKGAKIDLYCQPTTAIISQPTKTNQQGETQGKIKGQKPGSYTIYAYWEKGKQKILLNLQDSIKFQ